MLSNITMRTLLFILLALGGLSLYAQPNNTAPNNDVSLVEKPLTGFVDMHSHPRSDLAYGTELFYGKPYGDIATALGSCKAYHGMWGAKNKHGNVFRNKIASQTEQQYDAAIKDDYEGYPNFATWPSPASVLHQQMWVDWIRRAHEGGLNIMVALAAHSHCIASAAQTKGPLDDETVLTNVIQGIKDLANSTDFMEVAYTPADVRRIVGSGKLAVILGLEMENIGNFYTPAEPDNDALFNPNPTGQEIRDELDKLWNMGVRYIFPIHITNNIFGGTSLCIPALNVPNKFNTGQEFIPEEVSTPETGISFVLTHPILTTNPEKQFLAKVAIRIAGGILPKSVNPSIKANYTFWEPKPHQGHRNSMGLTDKGQFAIHYMMQKGFMIDIDHMSEKTATSVLGMAVQNDYPVNSGHSGMRDSLGSERELSLAEYAKLKQVGGMVGAGNGNRASLFVKNYRGLLHVMGDRNVAIGTDAGGFYPLPFRDSTIHLDYAAAHLTKCTTGNRTWDINVDGVAHYGLLPDYIKCWELAGMTSEEEKTFMSSAEYFTQMWEKCERRKVQIKQ